MQTTINSAKMKIQQLLVLCFGVIKAQDIPYIKIEKNHNKCNITTYNLLPINCDQPIYPVVHGWGEGVKIASYNTLIKELLAKKYNSYFVDWQKIATNYFYPGTDVKFVGKCLGEYLNATIYQKCQKPFVYLTGHSLGAHVAAIASKWLQKSGFLPDVIMGLDPAGPNFYVIERAIRLNRNDAKLVVHLQTSLWGLPENVGKVMFSANGGVRQTGCPLHPVDKPLIQLPFCSHYRSVVYFTESVAYDNFVACKCTKIFGIIVKKNCGETLKFNINIPFDANGTYCFDTNGTPPYGKG